MEKGEIIFGTRAVIEAIRAHREIEKIYVQSGLSNDLIKELTQMVRENDLPLSFVPVQKLNRLSNKNHQGVICMLSPISYVSIDNLSDKAYSEGRSPLFIILDRITDVRNMGAIARTAECAGADALVLADRGNAPITADTIKTSAGALHHLPVCREKDLKKTIRFLKDSGIQIVACTEKATQTIYEVDLSVPTALMLGSEEDGISASLLELADHEVKIPLNGKIESLNVSVAAGVALFEIIRQQFGAK